MTRRMRIRAKPAIMLIIACIALTKNLMANLEHQPIDRARAIREIVRGLSPESDWELNKIMDALLRASETNVNCKVLVIDAPFANAITLPTGEVLITEQLLSLLHTVDEVAFVLAHELAHAIRGDAKHIPYADISLGVKLQIEPAVDKTLIAEGLRAIANLARAIYSQELESNADELAVKLMAKAGFDTRASLSVLERLSKSEAAMVDAWLATHPGAAQRINRLMASRLPEPQYRATIQPPKNLIEVAIDLNTQIQWCDAALSEMMRMALNECLVEQLKTKSANLRVAKPWQRRRATVLLIKLSLSEQHTKEMRGMKGWLIWTQKLVTSVLLSSQGQPIKSEELELIAIMREGEKQSEVMRWRIKGIATWLAKIAFEALSEHLLMHH
ncbi:MAG: M48 family metallopeptidase [Armatimonadota bacterium]|nr:M48 family metallopeptidase [Armatimonadota bacterium]MCX7776748.1 M48 family metallopeptidase [Armatimonadota bacterium]MDW8024546.1 M48 family metallopeptidase [Armatimonadota bacterium]